MKTVCVTSAILFVCTAVAPVGADTCIKQKRHTDEYYYGGVITPEDNTESELWFGGKKIAVLLPNRIIITDAETNVLIFANKRDSSYVETTLPFDWANVLDEGTLGYLARYCTEGTIEETGEKKQILGHQCTLYKLETWIEDGGERFNQREERIWLTTDLPIDWEAHDTINVNLMKLLNYDAGLIEAFSAARGIVIESDADVYQKGFSVKSTERTTEILERRPESDVYTLPSYFKKKEQLTMADLRG